MCGGSRSRGRESQADCGRCRPCSSVRFSVDIARRRISVACIIAVVNVITRATFARTKLSGSCSIAAWQSFFHWWTVPDFYWAQDQSIAAERQSFVAQLELGAVSSGVPRDWGPNREKLAFQVVIFRVGFMVDGEAVIILSTEGSDSDH